MIVCVLLAAGESSRMGRPKSLLPFGDATFSRSVLTAMLKGGARSVFVVVGSDPGPIVAHLCDLGLRFIYNSSWPKGQLSSLQAAIRACPKSVTGILVSPVDQPGLRSSTVRQVLRAARRFPGKIVVASHRGRRGHPAVFPRRFFKELLSAPHSKGARVVVRKHLKDRVDVATSDPAVVRDIDTVREYSSL